MQRRAIRIRGIVQGVGFRPFVQLLAVRCRLAGFVRNQSGEVLVEAEGEPQALDRFVVELQAHPPPLAQIESVAWETRPVQGDRQFQIEASDTDASGTVFLCPDTATCADCLAELFDPADRRYRYPFLNCTHCGPRLTIITGAPYDRQRTTMAGFPLCPACRAEYDDPTNRRFHAQPTACPACGPQLSVCRPSGERLAVEDPLRAFAAALGDGQIGAVKGLGGYHLACDATRSATVAALRRRKQREEKPFAVMVRDVAAAQALVEVEAAERALLESPRRPIVLLRKRSPCAVAPEVAPGNPWLGVMLPYTPLHHLLLAALDRPLVMTSGNRAEEPIAYGDDEALRKLAGIADLFLVHNRPIHVRCDDSVTRILDGQELPVRRARGYAPQPLELPVACPWPLLAVGGQLKATFALGRGRQAFVSHHLGDLDHYETYQAFLQDLDLYQRLFEIRPRGIACDLHPDYRTSHWAIAWATRAGTPLLRIQHHHAHLASCMTEQGLSEPVLGVVFDGTGYGTDGAIWGGEFLLGDYRQCRRLAHLRYVGLPGGDQAIREPWRMALAHLVDAGLAHVPLRASPHQVKTIRSMLERGLQAPPTSSAGRLFDAVAALAGVRDRVRYEGQAAIELEGLAWGLAPDGAYPFALDRTQTADASRPLFQVDTRPLIRAIAQEVARGVEAGLIARRFHTTLVELIATVLGELRQAAGCTTVVLSGGVFLNGLLTRELCTRLQRDGFSVYRHCRVPPSDGGLSLGQLAIAAVQGSEPGASISPAR